MHRTIRHRFDVSAETWWNQVFFDPNYLTALHHEGLGCRAFEVVRLERDADGRVHQELATEPRIIAPPVIRKAIGERVRYRERGLFDPRTGRYEFEIIPSSLTAATRIQGVITLESPQAHSVERVCDLQFEVKVRGVGRLIEAFIGRSYTQSINRAGAFTQTWIARAGVGAQMSLSGGP